MAAALLLRRFIIAPVKIYPRTFLTFSFNDTEIGRIVFELRTDICPKTSENFRQLCIGKSGKSASGHTLCYRGSPVTRVIPGIVAQGGDITKFNGAGGASIYGETFPDENFYLKNDRRGLLGMANAGANSNGSQFYILLGKAEWLDGHHCVFGRVVEGMDVVRKLEEAGTAQGTPKVRIYITDCGVVDPPQQKPDEKKPDEKKPAHSGPSKQATRPAEKAPQVKPSAEEDLEQEKPAAKQPEEKK